MTTCNNSTHRSGRLICFADMLRFYGWHLGGVLHDLAILETSLQAQIKRDGASGPLAFEVLTSAILDARNAVMACEHYPGMRPATETARRCETHLRHPDRLLTCGELEVEIRNLREAILEELPREHSISVPRQYADFIDNEALFGEIVRTAFPSATADIRDAGNCIAVSLDTAAVFHLMRAVELALRALAKERRVRLKKGGPIEYAEWQEIISAIRTNMEKTFLPWRKGAEKSAALEYYYDLLNQFSGFKDAFRNHVMHTRATYTAPQAAAILASVKAFFERISTLLDEHGTRIRWKRPPRLRPQGTTARVRAGLSRFKRNP